MRFFQSIAVCTSFCLGLAGCASTDGIDRADRNQFVTEFYAIVYDVQQVKFQSNVGPAMTVGAISGALDHADGNREEIIGGAILGGLLGGIFTSLFEGSSKGYEYQLDAIDGDRVTVIVDEYAAMSGDCVKVRVSGSVYIYPEHQSVCDLAIEDFYDAAPD